MVETCLEASVTDRTGLNGRCAWRSKILVHAYWQQNLGDDLFVRALCDRYPDVLFLGSCRKSKAAAFADVANFRRIPTSTKLMSLAKRLSVSWRPNRWLQRQVERRVDAVVNIGGSIFIESEDWQGRMSQMRERFAPSHPSFVIGANVGPSSDPRYLSFVRELLADTLDVCVRDRESQALLSMPNCRYAPDVLLALRSPITTPQPIAVISVIDLQGRPQLATQSSAYDAKLIELAKEANRRGMKAVFMSFCVSEGDHRVFQRLSPSLQREGIDASHHIYVGNTDESLGMLAAANIIIATRFHALILAWLFNKPVLPIAYSTKTENVIRDYGYRGHWVSVSDIESLSVGESINAIMSRERLPTDPLRQLAETQFAGLDAFLRADKIS